MLTSSLREAHPGVQFAAFHLDAADSASYKKLLADVAASSLEGSLDISKSSLPSLRLSVRR